MPFVLFYSKVCVLVHTTNGAYWAKAPVGWSFTYCRLKPTVIKYNQAKVLYRAMALHTHRAGWRIAGLHVALREGGSIRLEFSFGAFLCFKTKKSGCCFIEPNHHLG
jgi:hypothetical protein